jgi:RNA polymerase sigma-70 factor (ECF subfamily)
LGVPKNTGGAGLREQERLALIRRIATGDQSALADLYDAMSRQVYGLALRILSDTGAAEEVTLEVFTQVWKQAGLFDLSRGTPSAWLCTLARSRAIDRLRSGAQERRRAEPIETVAATAAVDTVDPETSAVDAERRVRVRAALDKLPPDQREAIELAYFGGYSHTEIAEQLGQPLGTVKTRIRLAMVRLREALVDYKEDASA